MVSRKQSVLAMHKIVITILAACVLGLSGHAQSSGGPSKRFYSDDPLWQEPAPRSTPQVKAREVDDLYDFVENRFVLSGQENNELKQGSIRAGDVMERVWVEG